MSSVFQPNSQSAGARKEPHQVFVYGTLKKGFGNHDRHLKTAKFLGQAQIEGIMFHLGGFPAINLGDRFTRILGEVYQVTWDDIIAMDQLEGHPNFYQRVEISVYPYNKAWVYILPHEQASTQKWIIPSGLWRGPDSPKVAWAGWNKGVLVGTFQSNRDTSTILLGDSDTSPFILRKNEIKGKYEMVNSKTKEIIGEYSNLGDIIKQNQRRPTLSLPSPMDSRTKTVGEEVKRQIYRNAVGPDNYNPPPRRTIIDYPSHTVEAPKKPEIPQTAKLMGYEAKEA